MVKSQIRVIEASQRKNRISLARPIPSRTSRVTFQGKPTDLPVKRVALELPVYRMANIRTLVRQQRYIAANKIKDTFFSLGQENVSAQRAQHVFLAELARDPGKNIFSRLQSLKQQSDPLITTETGVVVNGNRRLAAMRELVSLKPKEFREFTHVDIAVLPEAVESDITALETDLQIAQDLKLDYGWVEMALGLKRQIDELGWDLNTASGHWGQQPQDLSALQNRLSLAEEYLQYAGKPHKYEDVEADEQAFKTLQEKQGQGLRRHADPTTLEAERFVVFAVIANKKTVRDRVYAYASNADAVTAAVVRMLPKSAAPVPSEGKADVDDPLSKMPRKQTVPIAAIAYLRRFQNSSKIADKAQEAYADIVQQRASKKRSGQFASDSTRINSLAAALSVAGADPKTAGEAVSELVVALSAIAKSIGDAVKKFPAAATSVDSAEISRAKDLLTAIAAAPKSRRSKRR